jgi:predicted nucleic acid-binding protein
LDAVKFKVIVRHHPNYHRNDVYAQLRLHGPLLGEGESESIAIARARNYIVATDDSRATEECREIFPDLEIVTTNQILRMAKEDGLLKQQQINEMWRLIRIRRK